MKSYNIPIVWESYKNYIVEANSAEEAVSIALKQFLSEPDENYLDDSFSIDPIIFDDYPEENIDLNKAINKVIY